MFKSSIYQPRVYKEWIKDRDLISFNVSVKETDLFVRAKKNLSRKCLKLVEKYREIIEKYIIKNPLFLTTLKPYPEDDNAPQIIKDMISAGKKTNVGPMASVAGVIAEYVGKELLQYSDEIIVENGGDIFMKTLKHRTVAIYTGENSPFSRHVEIDRQNNKTAIFSNFGIKIRPEWTPLGICTSSGKVGHSLSFGTSDAVVIVSKSAALADATATATGNLIKKEEDIEKGIEFVKKIEDITGVVIIINKKAGIWGNIEICQL